MMTLFSQEYAVERYGEEKMIEGQLNEKIATAFRLNKQGLPDSAIAAAVDVDIANVRQWLAGTPSLPPNNRSS